jgi:hypothetical protein
VKFTIAIFLLLSISWSVHARDGAKILAIHSNKKGILINQGSDDGIAVGDDGIFFLQKSVDFPKLIPVAEGKAIIIEKNHSGWYLTKLHQRSLLVKHGTLLFIRGQDTLEGRSSWDFLQRKRIFTKKSKISRKTPTVPDALVVKAKDYKTTILLPTITRTNTKDITTSNYGIWREQEQQDGKRQKKYIYEIDKVKDRNKVEKRIRNNVLKRTTDATVEKFNNLERGLYSLYKDQEMGGFVANSKFSQPNTYQEFSDENVKYLRKMSPQMINLIRREGGRWSRNFNDSELRRELIQGGIVHKTREKYRKIEDQANHELLFHVNSSLTDHTVQDGADQQGRGAYFAIGYEYHLQSVDVRLSSFALDVGFLAGANFTAIDGRNARTEEQRFQLGAKWYLKGGPQVIGKKTWYVGIGFARGTARVYRSTANANEPISWRADVLSLPYYTIGFKYRFRAKEDLHTLIPVGLGFHLGAIHERYLLSPSSKLGGGLNGTTLTTDVKLLVGLSIYI